MKVRYETEVFTSNDSLEPGGFSSVVFRNIGTDAAYLFQDLPLTTDGEDYALINRPEENIESSIPISFSTGTGSKVIAVKIYYDK